MATHLGWTDLHTSLTLYSGRKKVAMAANARVDGEILTHLNANIWLRRQPAAREAPRHEIRQQLRSPFRCDDQEWKKVVFRQTRGGLLRTLQGLESS